MRCDIQFTDMQVVEFCRATCDWNTIHNPEFMASRGKHVVVPGMFLFALIVDLLYTRVGRTFDSFRVYFNSVISTGSRCKWGTMSRPG
jgi:acyl dehydratase